MKQARGAYSHLSDETKVADEEAGCSNHYIGSGSTSMTRAMKDGSDENRM